MMRPAGDIIRDIVLATLMIAMLGSGFAILATIVHNACGQPRPASTMIFIPRLEF